MGECKTKVLILNVINLQTYWDTEDIRHNRFLYKQKRRKKIVRQCSCDYVCVCVWLCDGEIFTIS